MKNNNRKQEFTDRVRVLTEELQDLFEKHDKYTLGEIMTSISAACANIAKSANIDHDIPIDTIKENMMCIFNVVWEVLVENDKEGEGTSTL